jgi:eukaryotic-like serine/threonine-protein kinase
MTFPNNSGSQRDAFDGEHVEAQPSFDRGPGIGSIEAALLTVRLEDLQESRKTESTAVWPGLPGYEILRELGRGGMGIVYLARDLELNRPVALKMLLPARQANDRELTRFRREAEAVAHLQHPNVVQIHAVGQVMGRPYLVLEFCDGGNLEERLDGTPLPPVQAARLVLTLARAVQHAHSQGIVHRDLKPANVLLRRKSEIRNPKSEKREEGSWSDFGFRISDFEPKVTDFGLAKRLDQPRGPTRSGVVLGTPSYMAPEQASNGGQALDPRVDVYALGAILYELVTGRPPFKGESALDTLQLVVHEEPVSPARLRPGCPRDLETIILKCLHKDPRRRYASAQALAEDCTAFLRQEPIRARATPSWERVGKWVRRHPAAAVLLAGSCLALAGLVGAGVWHTAELRTAVHAARLAEKSALETAQLTHARAEARELLHEAEKAFTLKEWDKARLQADQALTALGARSELADLAARAERLRDDCLRRQNTLRRYEEFLTFRDEAFFHASLFTGLDTAANREKTITAANMALAQFGFDGADQGSSLSLCASLEERQRTEIVAGCYDLLLVLAEATATSVPGQPQADRQRQLGEALAILERAERLGLPSTKAYHLRQARYLNLLGRQGEAVAHRARAEKIEPVSAADHFLIGDERRARGDLAQACRDYERALRSQPNHFWAQYSLALCCLRLQRLSEARIGLTACLGQRPDFAWLYALRGFIHVEVREFRAAEEDFAQALTLKPDETTRYAIHANRGVLRFEQARTGEALRSLHMLSWVPVCGLYGSLGLAYRQLRLTEAVNELREAIQLKPGNYQAHVSLAQVYAAQGQVAAARAEFTKAIKLAPELAYLYRTRADFAWQHRNWPAARKDLVEAIRREPEGSQAAAEDQVKLGQLLQREGEYEAAARAYEAALRGRPDLAGTLRLRAVAMLELHKYEEAARSLDRYLAAADAGRERPTLAEAYRLRGLTRTQLGRYEGALHDYTRALELEPDSATRTYRGWIYLVQGAPKLALSDFEEALRLDPSEVDAYNGRGNARVKGGQVLEGVEDAEEAVRRGPSTSRTLHNAAAIYALASAAPEAVRRTSPGKTLQQEYQDRALDLLARSLAAVPSAQQTRFWNEQIGKDPDLEPIRHLLRYQQLAPGTPRR